MVAAVPVQNSAGRWLQCGSWLLGFWAVYTLCSGFSEFFNGVFINQYRFGFPAFIAVCQALLTVVVLQLLSQARLLKIQPYSLESGEIFLLPSICFSFHSVLTLWAVTSSNSVGFNFIRQFTPLATLALTEIFKLKKRTSSNSAFLVLLVTLCSALAGIQNFTDEALVYAYGVLNLMFKSTYLILIQEMYEDRKSSVVDVYYTCSINTCPLLLLYCLLHPDTPQIFSSGSWSSLIFLGFFSLVLLLGCLLNFLVFLCTLMSSALTMNIFEVAKTDILMLRNISPHEWTFSLPLLTSLLISISGVGVYMYKEAWKLNTGMKKEAMCITT